jgi:hypothetical protein
LSPFNEAEEWEWDWKSVALRRSIERDQRPFVCIDDDIDVSHGGAVTPREWEASLFTPSVLAAESDTGLLPGSSMRSRISSACTAPRSKASETASP